MATVEKVEKIKVAAYCRVSTASSQQASSYENQVEYFNRELSRNPEYELVKIYADSISGTKLRRTEFDKMIFDSGVDIMPVYDGNLDIRKNKIDYHPMASPTRTPKHQIIFVKDTSRFARNINVLPIIDKMASKGVYVNFLDYGISTDRAEDRDRLVIMLQLAESESRLKSKKTKWGFDESIRRGEKIHTNTKLFGYRYIQAENRLEVNEEEANVVRQIYELYSQGEGARRIANILMEQGMLTREGKRFCKSSIMRLLTNEKYMGVSNRGKYDTGLIFVNKSSYPKIKEGYKLTQTDKIPTIIEPELFNKCQEIMHGKVNFLTRKGVYNGLSEYSGLLFCSKCGSVYYSNRYVDKRQEQHKTYDYYICGKRKLKGKKACDSILVDKQDIDNFFTEMMEKNFAIQVRYDWEQTIQKLTNLQYFLMGKVVSRDIEQLEKLNAEILELTASKNRWLDLYGSGRIGIKDIEARIQPLDEQLQQMQAVITELTRNPRDFIEQVNKTKANIEAIRKIELVKHDWFSKPSGAFASYNDVITKDFYTKQEILECISKIVVSETESGGVDLSLSSFSTTKKYEQFIESFGQDLDALETLSEDDKISLEQRYQKILDLYQ